MDQRAAARLDSLTKPSVGLFWTRLNTDPATGRLGDRFRHQEMPQNRMGWIFGVVEKAPPGTRWKDGSNWKLHGGITRREGEILERTSESDEELVQRMIDLVIHKKNTAVAEAVAGAAPSLTPEQVQSMILEAATKLAKQMVEQAKAEAKGEVKVGLQHKPRKGYHQQREDKAKRIALWTERARLCGIGAPELRPRDGNLNGFWLRRAKKAWEAYSQKQPEAAPTA